MSHSHGQTPPIALPAMPSAPPPGTVKDLVCGMDVDPKSPGILKAQHKGKTYYFCAESCRKSFEANPGKYVRKEMAAPDMSGMTHTSE